MIILLGAATDHVLSYLSAFFTLHGQQHIRLDQTKINKAFSISETKLNVFGVGQFNFSELNIMNRLNRFPDSFYKEENNSRAIVEQDLFMCMLHSGNIVLNKQYDSASNNSKVLQLMFVAKLPGLTIKVPETYVYANHQLFNLPKEYVYKSVSGMRSIVKKNGSSGIPVVCTQ